MSIAALATVTLSIGQAAGHLTLAVVATLIGLALLFPVVPFAVEMWALRHLTRLRSAP